MLQVALDASKVAAALPCALVAVAVLLRLRLRYRLSKNPGVRAPRVASNPLTVGLFFLEAAYMQATNRLVGYYDTIFTRLATPGADPGPGSGPGSGVPDTVEASFAWRRVIVTRDPAVVKAVLTTQFARFGKGALFHDAWAPFLGDAIFTTDGPRWQQSRALLRPMFTRERVRDLDIFDRWTARLVSLVPPRPGRTVDVCGLFYRMTLDVTTDFLLGEPVGALDNPDSAFARAFTDVQRTQMILTILHPFRAFIPKRKYNDGIRLIERFVDPYIQATLRLAPAELDKLSRSDREFTFLHSMARQSRDPRVIRDQLMAVLLAGRDTTAATLSWAVYELANAPRVWAALRAQVLATVGPRAAPTYDHLKGLPLLSHTLNETLRLWPAVPYNLRSCLESSTLPAPPGQPDIAALPGDIIIYSTLAMQRRRDLYPPVSDTFADPAVFSPDRWEHWTPKPWHYLPFNGGPRICIGQNFALTEMAFTLVRLLQRYERLEYRGDWSAQYHKADIVGCPGQGVPVAFFEPGT